ncbi:MAG: histidine kinase [Bacteroidales bacterium]|nr:histidine kinase [Bacteroidales bacterium]
METRKLDNNSRSGLYLNHWAMLGIAIAFSWILWSIVNIPVFRQLSGWRLVLEILKEFAEQIIETTILLELSLLYIKIIVNAFWTREHSVKNLLAQIMILTVFNGIISVASASVYQYIYPLKEGLFAKIAFTDYLNLSVLTTAWLVFFLMNKYREEELVGLQAKLNNLSLQINNHFVFNSMSTLSSLISSDPEEAKVFLQEFTDIYRYLVTNADKSVIAIKDEIAFVRRFADLLQQRYSGVSLVVSADVESIDGYVCPIAIQNLVENAIKHNRHGKGNPLTIKIKTSDGYIVVSNNLMERDDISTGTGTGLQNLKNRYSLLTGKTVIVAKKQTVFEVRIPILYPTDLRNESTDY